VTYFLREQEILTNLLLDDIMINRRANFSSEFMVKNMLGLLGGKVVGCR